MAQPVCFMWKGFQMEKDQRNLQRHQKVVRVRMPGQGGLDWGEGNV